jgi:hypothetical protein
MGCWAALRSQSGAEADAGRETAVSNTKTKNVALILSLRIGDRSFTNRVPFHLQHEVAL